MRGSLHDVIRTSAGPIYAMNTGLELRTESDRNPLAINHPAGICFRILELTNTDNQVRRQIRNIFLGSTRDSHDDVTEAANMLISLKPTPDQLGVAIRAEFAILLDAPIVQNVLDEDAAFTRELLDAKISDSPYSSVVLAANKMIDMKSRALFTAMESLKETKLWCHLKADDRIAIWELLEQISLSTTMIRCAAHAETLIASAILLVCRKHSRLISSILSDNKNNPSSTLAIMSRLQSISVSALLLGDSTIELLPEVMLSVLSVPSLSSLILAALPEVIQVALDHLSSQSTLSSIETETQIFSSDELKYTTQQETALKSFAALEITSRCLQVVRQCLQSLINARADPNTTKAIDPPVNPLLSLANSDPVTVLGRLSADLPPPNQFALPSWPLTGRELSSNNWGWTAVAGSSVSFNLFDICNQMTHAVKTLCCNYPSLYPSATMLRDRAQLHESIEGLHADTAEFVNCSLLLGCGSSQSKLDHPVFSTTASNMISEFDEIETSIANLLIAVSPSTSNSFVQSAAVTSILDSDTSAIRMAIRFSQPKALLSILTKAVFSEIVASQKETAATRIGETHFPLAKGLTLPSLLEAELLPNSNLNPEVILKTLGSKELPSPFKPLGRAVLDEILKSMSHTHDEGVSMASLHALQQTQLSPQVSLGSLAHLSKDKKVLWSFCVGLAVADEKKNLSLNDNKDSATPWWTFIEASCGKEGISASLAAANLPESDANHNRLRISSELFLSLSKLAAASAASPLQGPVDEILMARTLENVSNRSKVESDIGWALVSVVDVLRRDMEMAGSDPLSQAAVRQHLRVELSRIAPLMPVLALSGVPEGLEHMWTTFWSLVVFTDAPLLKLYSRRSQFAEKADGATLLRLLNTTLADCMRVIGEACPELLRNASNACSLQQSRAVDDEGSGRKQSQHIDLTEVLRGACGGDAGIFSVCMTIVNHFRLELIRTSTL